MPRQESFDVQLDGTAVRCRLDLPALDPKGDPKRLPTVMLCRGLPAQTARAAELPGQITEALVDAGMAVATISSGSDAAPGARLAVESIDDAAAVFHGLVVRDEVDINRVSVLGHSVGCIVAACLARRTDQIARLCLLSPITPAELGAKVAGDPEGETALQLGATEVPPGYFEGLDALTPFQDLATYDRPTLIVHGAADRLVSLASSLDYTRAVEAAGHNVDFIQVAMADHFYSSMAARAACLDQLARFFSAAEGATARS